MRDLDGKGFLRSGTLFLHNSKCLYNTIMDWNTRALYTNAKDATPTSEPWFTYIYPYPIELDWKAEFLNPVPLWWLSGLLSKISIDNCSPYEIEPI